MPRIRTIKPELYRHVALFDAEQACGLPLRLAFTGLLTCADREGRFKWEPRVLKLDILPFDTVDFAAVLDALSEAGFILKYSVNEKNYGVIPSWHEHQRINPHEPPSRLPDPTQYLTPLSTPIPQANTTCPSPSAPILTTQEQPALNRTVTESASPTQETLWVQDPVLKKKKETHTPSPPFPQVATSSAVQTIFEHWKTTFHHTKALLDDKRQQFIQKALKQGYTVNDVCDAITGCAQTPYNCGDNNQGERYDGLHTILRDADQIERFIRHCYSSPQPTHPQNKRLKASAIAAERWLQQAHQEVTP